MIQGGLTHKRAVFIKHLQLSIDDLVYKMYTSADHNGVFAIWFDGKKFIAKWRRSGGYRLWMDKFPEKLVGVYTPKADVSDIKADMMHTLQVAPISLQDVNNAK